MADALSFTSVFIDTSNAIFTELWSMVPQFMPFIILATTMFVVYRILLFIIIHVTKNRVIVSNREELLKIFKYAYFFLAAFILVSAIAGGLSNLGLTVGLLTAALGWALQKPITS